MLKKPMVQIADPKHLLKRVELPKILKTLPLIAEVLVQPVWGDSDNKGESALMVFRKGQDYRALLKVEVPALSLSVPGTSLDHVLSALEAILGGDDIPWAPDASPLGKRVKKR